MKQATSSQRYGLVVLAASLLSQVFNVSVLYVSGVFYVALKENYPDSTAVSSWVGSFYISMFALSGPVASVVVNMFDCRTCVFLSGLLGLMGYSCSSLVSDVRLFFLTLSLLSGLGAGFSYVGSITICGYYFPDKTSLVSGIVTSGTALGLFIHPPLTQYLIDVYGLSGSFLIIGAMVSNCCVFGFLMRPTESEKENRRLYRGGKITIVKNTVCGSCLNANDIIKNPSFVLFATSVILFGLAYSATVLYMPDYFKSKGATLQQASVTVSLQGLGSLFSRPLTGCAANDKSIGGGILYPSCVGILGIISAFITKFSQSYAGMLAYGFCFGFYTGGVITLFSIRTFEVAGTQMFAHSFGLVMFGLGVALLLGPPAAGALYDGTGDYTNAFLFSMASLLSQVVNIGVLYVSGVFYVALKEKYPDSTAVLSWVGSHYTPMFALDGPVASVVVNMFGCRTCLFLSGYMGLVSYSCSSLVSDVRLLFLTLPLLSGLLGLVGYSCSGLVSDVRLLFFTLPLLSGIATSGAALGLFIHPPLTQYLIESYDLLGAFLIIGAVVSHCCVFGIPMRLTESEKENRRLYRGAVMFLASSVFGFASILCCLVKELVR